MKVLSLENLKLKSVFEKKDKVWRKARNMHTVDVFQDNLVLFGG